MSVRVVGGRRFPTAIQRAAETASAVRLDTGEQQAMDDLLASYRTIVGWGLSANSHELTAAVHVIQGFIVQHMLGRLDPESWGDWFRATPRTEASEQRLCEGKDIPALDVSPLFSATPRTEASDE